MPLPVKCICNHRNGPDCSLESRFRRMPNETFTMKRRFLYRANGSGRRACFMSKNRQVMCSRGIGLEVRCATVFVNKPDAGRSADRAADRTRSRRRKSAYHIFARGCRCSRARHATSDKNRVLAQLFTPGTTNARSGTPLQGTADGATGGEMR